jgi:tRNA threonylcarbamoyladenosine biosynthesis protein TsaB
MTAATAAHLLAFDTSTESLALATSGPAGEHFALAAGGAAASATLLPSIHALLAKAGLALHDLQAIAFGQGPGAFTGLRTSCAVAQGLAFGLGCPLLPLDSLLLVAEDARAQDCTLCDVAVLMDARMNEVYGGRYRWAAGRWQTRVAPALYTLPAAAALWSERPDAVAGSALAAFGERLGLPPGLLRVAQETARPAALLRLAQAAFTDGAGIDAALALPLYLRDKVALTIQEREAARAASAGTQ